MTTETPDYLVFKSDLEEITAEKIGAVPMLDGNYASAGGLKVENGISKTFFNYATDGFAWYSNPDINDSLTFATFMVVPSGDDNEEIIQANAITLMVSRKKQNGLPESKRVKIYGEHNVTSGTTDLTAGVSPLGKGCIHIVYE